MGSNCIFPIETHITCDFPGGVRTCTKLSEVGSNLRDILYFAHFLLAILDTFQNT